MARTPAGPASVALVVSARDGEWCESAATLLTRLTALGFDAHVLFEGDSEEVPAFAEIPDEIRWQRVHPPPRSLRDRSHPGLRRPFLGTVARHPLSAARRLGVGAEARHLRMMLFALRPRVVHVGSAAAAAGWASSAALIGAGLAVGVRAEELAGKPEAPAGWSATWSVADAVLVESEALAEVAISLGAPEHALTVVPPVLAPQLVDESRPPPGDGPLRILSKGPLSWTQGFEHSLQAIRLLADAGVVCSYRIVGSGDFVDALFFARHQLDIGGLVEFVEAADGGGPSDLDWAQVLVDPAVVPSSPHVVYSALTRGIPVVTAQPPPGAEAAVLSVPRRDPRALADALGSLAGDARLFQSLAEAGRELADTLRSRDDGFRELVGLYRRLSEATAREPRRRRSRATRS